MNDHGRAKDVLQLLQSAALPAQRVEVLLGRARDPNYWRALNPDLSVEGDSTAEELEGVPLSSEQLAKQIQKIHREGYFQTGPVLEPLAVKRMLACIEKVQTEGWPPVFSFVYDAFWQVAKTPSMVRLVSGFLGPDYRQNVIIWTYYVAPVSGASGWQPHFDSSEGSSRLTVWIPLTDATIENGCMYVIPCDRMPPTLPTAYADFSAVTREEVGQLLQAVKALPAPAGALLGWHHQLIHWGSTSSGHTRPRISIAVVFIAGGSEPKDTELPLLDPVRLPPFPERLRMIGRAIGAYKEYEPLMHRYAGLGKNLAETT